MALWPGAVIGALLALAPLFEQARRPLQHVTPPATQASLSAAECGGCHAVIYAQWQGSRHAQSFSNRIFAASFRRDPRRWCVYCHAPLPAQTEALLGVHEVRPGASPLVDEGVNCAVCHVRDGAILVARPPSSAALRAHPVRLVAGLGQSAFCAGCHQFNFPRDQGPLEYTGEPMQDTLGEWRGAPGSGSCQRCHMAQGSHRFPGGHDAKLMRDTVQASVKALPQGGVRVVLRAAGAGHRVPTGDPFRRLVLELCATPDCDVPLGTVRFSRGFRKVPNGWALSRDTAIPPPQEGAAERTLDVIPEGPGARHWRLLYAYAAPSSERDLAGQDLSIEISRGAVLPANE